MEGDRTLVCTSEHSWEAKDMRADPRDALSVVDLQDP
jgi:hypothetical protein